MWAFVLLATLVAVLLGCWSIELGLVAALCAVLWCLVSPMTPVQAACRANDPSSDQADDGRVAARRGLAASRSARVAMNVDEQETRRRRRRVRPIVREALVQKVPLQPLLPALPEENILDACMMREQHRRSQSLHARHYHTTALPNAIRMAARELTTADPAIVPLDGTETCHRSLGQI